MHFTSRESKISVPYGLSESELVLLAVNGDEIAFEAIMRRHNQLMFRTARSVVRNDADAEEVVQEAWMRAWRALGGFRAESQLSTWLVRITTNEALGRLRRKSAQVIPLEAAMTSTDSESRMALTEDAERDPERSVERLQMRNLIETRIDLLPDAFRTVFVLRAIEELSVEETARALDIPEATVRTRYFRARSLMREGLAREMDFAFGDAFGFAGERCDRIVSAVLERGRKEGLSSQE